jgi:hypothetical protein
MKSNNLENPEKIEQAPKVIEDTPIVEGPLEPVDLSKMSKVELAKFAEHLGIEVKGLSKVEIAAAIEIKQSL